MAGEVIFDIGAVGQGSGLVEIKLTGSVFTVDDAMAVMAYIGAAVRDADADMAAHAEAVPQRPCIDEVMAAMRNHFGDDHHDNQHLTRCVVDAIEDWRFEDEKQEQRELEQDAWLESESNRRRIFTGTHV